MRLTQRLSEKRTTMSLMNYTGRRIGTWPNVACGRIDIGLFKINFINDGSGRCRVAYLLITSLTARESGTSLVVDAKEVSMISSRPTCPYAKELSAGSELGLNDQGIIFRKSYRLIRLETTCTVSVYGTGRV